MNITVKSKSSCVHKSSVIFFVIDPTSLFILSGSTVLHVCVTSCYLPEVDDNNLDDKARALKQDFGTTIYDFHPNCWINAVAWNSTGSLGFAAGQDASIAVIILKIIKLI